jgi:hypothetical protein
VYADRDGLDHGGLVEAQGVRQDVHNAGGDGDKFGEGTMTAVVTAGNAKNLAVIAEVHVAAFAMDALAAEDRRIEGHAVARGEAPDIGADGGDDARGLVAYVAVKDAVRTGDKVSFALPGSTAAADAPDGVDHAAIRAALDAAGYAGDYCCEVSGQVSKQPGYDPLAAARACHRNLAAVFH